jgi:2-C-methyl-D-erythritol 4-phosphate cytidylyltransferase
LTADSVARLSCVAIVPAGGSGARFGTAAPKQYSLIAGRAVLAHTLTALHKCAAIERIFVNVQSDDAHAEAAVAAHTNVTLLRTAGSTRAETVQNALKDISRRVRRDAWVLVHDAARPCVSSADLDRLISQAGAHPVGGLLAYPVSDTLKRANSRGEVTETVPRDGMWRAQTPQMFRYETLVHALASSPDVTDEAQAIEALGMSPLLVAGSARNIKITLPEDAVLAAYYLSLAEQP